ncbi:hypothetical protein SAMD00023353_1300240 [Rosellinia necatrix]|uniref:Rhodopsin domain-containing protein n=1 Tax=Rosellinia necatrix TaxID=77044 RepID=A0A1W2TCM5_ROSNE|nr:hypothetical protein SAMD00023353_1300240 [Rosellinia necatrix]
MDRREVSQNDASTVFQILLWFLYVVAVFSVGARLGTKYAMVRQVAWDDWIILAAQVAYLAQCVSISLGASQGLGKPMSSLSDGAVENFLMAEYTSFVFQLITLALIKWSISASIQKLSPSPAHRRLDWILRLVVGLWLVSAVLTSVFQCALPTPWDYFHSAQCINRVILERTHPLVVKGINSSAQRAWWTYVTIVNIATEFFIVALYFLIIGNLRIPLARRSVVLLIYSTRILIVGIALAQLAVFLNAFPYFDLTIDLWLPTVLNQATLSASVVTACGPYLRPFMESLETGMGRVDNLTGSNDGFAFNSRAGMSSHYLSDFSSADCSPVTDRPPIPLPR